jgi:uncharacterized protein (DUF1697 family)
MPRYVAFLRGVSPLNARMPELKRCFERSGFSDVKTVLSSGNVAFTARSTSPRSLERKAEAAMEKELGRSFRTIVRAIEELAALLADEDRGAEARELLAAALRHPSASRATRDRAERLLAEGLGQSSEDETADFRDEPARPVETLVDRLLQRGQAVQAREPAYST